MLPEEKNNRERECVCVCAKKRERRRRRKGQSLLLSALKQMLCEWNETSVRIFNNACVNAD